MSGERAYAALKDLRDALAAATNRDYWEIGCWQDGLLPPVGRGTLDMRLYRALLQADTVLAAQLPLDLDPSASATLARLPILHDSVISEAMQALADEMDHDPETAE